MSDDLVVAAAREVLAAWQADDEQEKNDLNERLWTAMGVLESALKQPTQLEVPEFVRRSGAKNIADSHLQSAFVDEARHAMGAPTKQDAEACLGQLVRLVFNDDRGTIQGILTKVVDTIQSAYLMLDDRDPLYALNAIQEIKVVPSHAP